MRDLPSSEGAGILDSMILVEDEVICPDGAGIRLSSGLLIIPIKVAH